MYRLRLISCADYNVWMSDWHSFIIGSWCWFHIVSLCFLSSLIDICVNIKESHVNIKIIENCFLYFICPVTASVLQCTAWHLPTIALGVTLRKEYTCFVKKQVLAKTLLVKQWWDKLTTKKPKPETLRKRDGRLYYGPARTNNYRYCLKV